MGMVVAVTMATVVGVWAGRRRVGDCLMALSPMLAIAISDLFPSSPTTGNRLFAFILTASVIGCMVYLLITRGSKSGQNPTV